MGVVDLHRLYGGLVYGFTLGLCFVFLFLLLGYLCGYITCFRKLLTGEDWLLTWGIFSLRYSNLLGTLDLFLFFPLLLGLHAFSIVLCRSGSDCRVFHFVIRRGNLL